MDPRVLQHCPFRLQTPMALRKSRNTARLPPVVLMIRPAEPMTFRVRPAGLEMIYRVHASWFA